jgi:hypothetical protein
VNDDDDDDDDDDELPEMEKTLINGAGIKTRMGPAP